MWYAHTRTHVFVLVIGPVAMAGTSWKDHRTFKYHQFNTMWRVKYEEHIFLSMIIELFKDRINICVHVDPKFWIFSKCHILLDNKFHVNIFKRVHLLLLVYLLYLPKLTDVEISCLRSVWHQDQCLQPFWESCLWFMSKVQKISFFSSLCGVNIVFISDFGDNS